MINRINSSVPGRNNSASHLKIGIVVDQLLAGGVQLAAIEQVKELLRLGYRAKLLILMRKKYPTDYSYLVKDVPHQYLSDSYPAYAQSTIKFPIFSFLSTLHLASPFLAPIVIKKNDYQVLISWGTTTCLTTQAIFKIRGIPYIAVIHDPINYILDKVYSKTYLKLVFPILKPIANHFEGSFVKDSSATVIISKVHKTYLISKYSIKPIIIHLGVNVTRKKPVRLGTAILSLGRWQKEKGPQFLLSLIKKIPNSQLIIAGTWTNNNDLTVFREKIVKENLVSRVKIITSYEEDELADICRKARVFVHPHFEAFGLAALEAASFGLPIIIPQKSGVTEKFQHGIHGYFPKKVDVNTYKNLITPLLNNEVFARQLGKNAQNVVRREFSWSKNVKLFLEIVKLSIKPKMVVLEIGHALDAPLAGGDKVMEPMAARLSQNIEFTIIVPEIGARHWKDARFDKALVILPKNPFDLQGSPIPVFLTYLVRMWQCTDKLLNSYYNFILYSSTNVLPDVFPAYIVKCFRPSTPWIARVHHLIPPPYAREGNVFVNTVSFLMQKLSLLMIKSKANITISLNESLKGELIERGFNKGKLRVLGAGIEVDKIITQSGHPQIKLYDGIFVGRFHRTKGVFDLVNIWKNVVSTLPNAKLAIVGTGPKEIVENITSDIRNAKLQSNVFLLGYLSDVELFKSLKKAKIFLFTDHEAGWGIAVAEAMACGLPVIGYNIGILGNVFKKGFLSVELENTLQFSRKVISLIRNDEARRKLSKEAIYQAKTLDWDNTTKKFENILTKLT